MSIPYVFNRMARGGAITFYPTESVFGVFIYNRHNEIVSSAMTVSNIGLTYFGLNRMEIWSAGSADSSVVTNSGSMSVSAGGRATNVTVNSSGFVYIDSGGVINGAEIKSSGRMSLGYGALVSNVIVSTGGLLNNSAGHATINGLQLQSGAGTLTLSGGALGTNFDIQSAANVTLLDGATISGATLASGGKLYVSIGGRALNVSHQPGGILCASIYGDDTESVIDGSNAYGSFCFSGGTASNLAVYSNANIAVYYGGHISNVRVHSKGSCHVYSRGTAVSTIVSSGGSLILDFAAINSGTVISTGGTAFVSGGGAINDATVEGQAILLSSAAASGTIIRSSGVIQINSCASGTECIIQNYGSAVVSPHGLLQSCSIAGGTAFIQSSAIASGNQVSYGGVERIEHNGSAFGTVVSSGGTQVTNESGYVSGTIVKSGGTAMFAAYTTVSGLVASAGGIVGHDLYVTCTYTSNGTAINIYGSNMSNYICSSGWNRNLGNAYSAADCVICSGASMTVSNGGLANRINILSGGYFRVSENGTATLLYLVPGARFNMDGNASISVANGGVITMDGETDCVRAVSQSAANTILSHQKMYILSGGSTASIGIGESGTQLVFSGGDTYNTVIYSGGSQIVLSGGRTVSAKVECSGALLLSGGTYCTGTISNGGCLSAVSDGTSIDHLIISAGSVTVYSSIEQHGNTIVISGATIYDGEGGSCILDSGVSAHHLLISGGAVTINSGAYAYGINVLPGASLTVCSGAVVSTVFANHGAKITGAEYISGYYHASEGEYDGSFYG